jgi:hypothetical protein
MVGYRVSHDWHVIQAPSTEMQGFQVHTDHIRLMALTLLGIVNGVKQIVSVKAHGLKDHAGVWREETSRS